MDSNGRQIHWKTKQCTHKHTSNGDCSCFCFTQRNSYTHDTIEINELPNNNNNNRPMVNGIWYNVANLCRKIIRFNFLIIYVFLALAGRRYAILMLVVFPLIHNIIIFRRKKISAIGQFSIGQFHRLDIRYNPLVDGSSICVHTFYMMWKQ